MLALVLGCGKERQGVPPAVEPASRASVEQESAAKPAPSPNALAAASKASPGAKPARPKPAGACTSPDTCYESARASLGRGDNKKARWLFEQACNQGHGPACFRLGVMYRDGKGVRPSDSRARQWFEQACRAGDNSGCDAIGH